MFISKSNKLNKSLSTVAPSQTLQGSIQDASQIDCGDDNI